MELVEFDDVSEEDSVEEKMNVSVKLTKDEKEMFSRIAKRERLNMANLGAKIVVDYINEYIKSYKNK